MLDERIEAAILGMKLLDHKIDDVEIQCGRYKIIYLNSDSNLLFSNILYIKNDHIMIVLQPYGTDFISRKLMDRYDFNSFSLKKEKTIPKMREFYELKLYGDIDSIIKMMVEFDDILPQFTSMVNRMMF